MFQKYKDEGAEDEDVKSVALELWEELWQPLTGALGETASIFISPDSLLNVLPFDVLTDEDDSYLLENFDLRIISSSRDLALEPLLAAKGELMIIAGPDYNSSKRSAVTGLYSSMPCFRQKAVA